MFPRLPDPANKKISAKLCVFHSLRNSARNPFRISFPFVFRNTSRFRISPLFVFRSLLLLFTLYTSTTATAQTLTVTDSAIISNRAKQLIKNLEERLNGIGPMLFEPSLLPEYINAVTKSNKRIFRDTACVVENDFLPPSKQNKRDDKSVKDYLSYIFNNYSKSESLEPTIFLQNVSISGLKFRDTLFFVQAYYEITLNGMHKAAATEKFPVMKRIAEISFSKHPMLKKYELYILSLLFYDESKPVTDTTNNIAFFDGRAEYEKRIRDGDPFDAGDDEKSEMNKRANYRKNAMLAFNRQNYPEALDFYTKLYESDKTDFDAKLRIDEISKLVGDQEVSRLKAEEIKSRFNRNFLAHRYKEAGQDYDNLAEFNVASIDAGMEEKMTRIRFVNTETSAMDLLYKGKLYDDVITRAAKNIEGGKNEPEFFYWRGKAFQEKDKLKNAFDDFTKAIDMDAKYDAAIEARAILNKQFAKSDKKKYSDAIADYTRLINNNNAGNSRYYIERAAIKSLVGLQADAISQDYAEAIKLDSKNPAVYFSKGHTEFDIGRYSEAVKSFSSAIIYSPDSAIYYYWRGSSYEKTDSTKQAGKDFRTASEKKLADSLRLLVTNISQTYFSNGLAEYKKGNNQSALIYFTKAVDIADNADAYFYAGQCNLYLKKYAAAIDCLTKSLANTRNADATEVIYSRGIGYFNINYYDEALADFKQCMLSANKNFQAGAYAYTGGVHYNQKKYDDAISNLQLAIKLKPDSANLHFITGMAYFKQQKATEAKTKFDKAIDLYSDDSTFYYYRGLTSASLKDYKNAIKDFKRAADLKLYGDSLKYNLALAYYESNDFDNAWKTFTEAINLNKNFGNAYYYQGLCLQKKESWRDAEFSFINAINSGNCNENFPASTRLAYAQLKLNKTIEAGRSIDAALSKRPADAYALFYKGCLQILLNQKDNACKYFEEALQTRSITFYEVKSEEMVTKDVRKSDSFKRLAGLYDK